MGYISSAVMNSGNTKSIFYPHRPRGKIQHCTFFPVKQSCPFSKPTSLSSDQKQLIATMGLLQNVLKKCQTTSPPNDFKIQFQALLHFCFLEQQIFSRHFKTKTPKAESIKDKTTIRGTEDVEDVLVNCSEKHLHYAGNASHLENPAGSLLCISFLS